MKHKKILFSGLLVLVFSRNAYAYIDPGTGSLILQSIIGIFLAVVFSIKQLKGIFIKMFGKKSEETSKDGKKNSK